MYIGLCDCQLITVKSGWFIGACEVASEKVHFGKTIEGENAMKSETSQPFFFYLKKKMAWSGDGKRNIIVLGMSYVGTLFFCL